jgi:AcrR family transcriptional regulator
MPGMSDQEDQDSARKLFNRHGFESVSHHQIMAGAGLTHVGFYSYFKCNSDLYAAVLGCFFSDPEWNLAHKSSEAFQGVQFGAASSLIMTTCASASSR